MASIKGFKNLKSKVMFRSRFVFTLFLIFSITCFVMFKFKIFNLQDGAVIINKADHQRTYTHALVKNIISLHFNKESKIEEGIIPTAAALFQQWKKNHLYIKSNYAHFIHSSTNRKMLKKSLDETLPHFNFINTLSIKNSASINLEKLNHHSSRYSDKLDEIVSIYQKELSGNISFIEVIGITFFIGVLTIFILGRIFILIPLTFEMKTNLKKLEKELSERKKIELELLDLSEMLQESVTLAFEEIELKKSLIGVLSHEIKTPITGIISTAKLLLKNNTDKDTSKFLNLISNTSEYLLNLINNILNFHKVSIGTDLIVQDFILGDIFDNVVNLTAHSCKEKNISLIVENNVTSFLSLSGDHVRLQQVLINILSNAVKYTDKGKIIFSLQLIEENDDDVEIEFKVVDTGVGINKNDFERIFLSYNQIDQDTSTVPRSGLGLGLSISKSIIHAMKGTIEVDSVINQGSTFTVLVRFKKNNKPLELVDTIDSMNKISASILLVEDCKINQEVSKAMLENIGCTVEVAEDGLEALEILLHNKFDLVFMDCNMPRMGGFDTTKKIREFNKEMPIIALSAECRGKLSHCLYIGMNDCLLKPADEMMLHNTILKWLPENKEGKYKMKSEFKTNILELLRQSLGDDYESFIQVFMKDTIQLIDEIDDAIESKNNLLLSENAHKLKGSMATLGAEKMSELSGQLENINGDLDQKQLNEIVLQLKAELDEVKKEIVNHVS